MYVRKWRVILPLYTRTRETIKLEELLLIPIRVKHYQFRFMNTGPGVFVCNSAHIYVCIISKVAMSIELHCVIFIQIFQNICYLWQPLLYPFHLNVGSNSRYKYSAEVKHGLTHWGRVTHICLDNLTIIGSDNGLSLGRRQAIIWTNAEMGAILITTCSPMFQNWPCWIKWKVFLYTYSLYTW